MTEREAAMRAFLEASGWGTAKVTPLPGDASSRRYARLDLNGRAAMLMDQPQQAETPAAPPGAGAEERRALGYNAVARLAGADCARFMAVAGHLKSQGLSAPAILAADAQQGFLLLEDLGDDLFADAVTAGADEAELYRAAVDVLVALHARGAPAALGGTLLHAYDETALVAETDLLTEWYLPLALDRAAAPQETLRHRDLWRAALAPLAHDPVLVHRDYHAQNLLWLPGRDGVARVGLIDFQDAVAGSRAYDLVSLLEDARRDVDPALAEAMTRHYIAAAGIKDEAAFRAEMAVMSAQRNAKILGIFARLARRDGKPRYLAFIPRVWGYLERDLAHPGLSALKAWYDATIPQNRRIP